MIILKINPVLYSSLILITKKVNTDKKKDILLTIVQLLF